MPNRPRNYVAVAMEVAFASGCRSQDLRDIARDRRLFSKNGYCSGLPCYIAQTTSLVFRRPRTIVSEELAGNIKIDLSGIRSVGTLVLDGGMLRRLANTEQSSGEATIVSELQTISCQQRKALVRLYTDDIMSQGKSK